MQNSGIGALCLNILSQACSNLGAYYYVHTMVLSLRNNLRWKLEFSLAVLGRGRDANNTIFSTVFAPKLASASCNHAVTSQGISTDSTNLVYTILD
jgi:hypothetical protein